MAAIDFTAVIATDRAHLRQLEIVLPTLRRNRPELFSGKIPWLVIFDRDELTPERVRSVLESEFSANLDLRLHAWPPPGLEYSNQRAKMLSACVHVPPSVVQTEWYMKLDTDVVAKHFDPRWIPNDVPKDVVLLAPRWGYSKPQNQMALLDTFGDGVPELAKYPRLDLPYDPAANKCCHARFCSWISFYRTSWAKEVSAYCPYGYLPVPSQDGYHFYCAARRGDRWMKYPAKQLGWANTPSTRKLLLSAAAVMELNVAPELESDGREEGDLP